MRARSGHVLALLLTVGACGGAPAGFVTGTIATTDGTFDPTLEADVNGQAVDVEVADDGTFEVDVPIGDVELGLVVRGMRGAVMLEDVLPSESIAVAVNAGPDALSPHVVDRDAPVTPPPLTVVHRGDIVLDEDGAVFRLPLGLIDGDVVILGAGVTLLGPGYEACVNGWSSYVEGTLEVYGSDARVVNVDVASGTTVHARGVEVREPCHEDRPG